VIVQKPLAENRKVLLGDIKALTTYTVSETTQAYAEGQAQRRVYLPYGNKRFLAPLVHSALHTSSRMTLVYTAAVTIIEEASIVD
jgi:hypothetical protein